MDRHEPPSEIGAVLMLVLAALFFWVVIESMSADIAREHAAKAVTR